MKVQKVTMAPQGPEFSEIVQGYWRVGDWNRSAQEHLSFLKQHIEPSKLKSFLSAVLSLSRTTLMLIITTALLRRLLSQLKLH